MVFADVIISYVSNPIFDSEELTGLTTGDLDSKELTGLTTGDLASALFTEEIGKTPNEAQPSQQHLLLTASLPTRGAHGTRQFSPVSQERALAMRIAQQRSFNSRGGQNLGHKQEANWTPSQKLGTRQFSPVSQARALAMRIAQQRSFNTRGGQNLGHKQEANWTPSQKLGTRQFSPVSQERGAPAMRIAQQRSFSEINSVSHERMFAMPTAPQRPLSTRGGQEFSQISHAFMVDKQRPDTSPIVTLHQDPRAHTRTSIENESEQGIGNEEQISSSDHDGLTKAEISETITTSKVASILSADPAAASSGIDSTYV